MSRSMSTRALFGRSAELSVLGESLLQARSGAAATAVVVGEAGIGKTSVLSAFCASARRAGVTVLAGQATEMERGVPFGIVEDALDSTMCAGRRMLSRALGADRMAELAAVFPSVATSSRPLARSELLNVERHRAHRAVAAALAELSAGEPLMVCLDDVHWADPASLELISFLVRRGAPKTLIVLAYRPAEAPSRLLTALDVRDRVPTHIRLGPLPIEAAARILPGVAADEVRALYGETGGNPFYLTEFARLAGERTTGRLPEAVARRWKRSWPDSISRYATLRTLVP